MARRAARISLAVVLTYPVSLVPLGVLKTPLADSDVALTPVHAPSRLENSTHAPFSFFAASYA